MDPITIGASTGVVVTIGNGSTGFYALLPSINGGTF